MSRRILYNGRAWNEEELPEEAKAKIIDIERDEDFDNYLFVKSMETHNKVLYEQNVGDRPPAKYFSDQAKARNTYWRGCSPAMNGKPQNDE